MVNSIQKRVKQQKIFSKLWDEIVSNSKKLILQTEEGCYYKKKFFRVLQR